MENFKSWILTLPVLPGDSLTVIGLLFLLHKAEIFEPLLLRRGGVDQGASLLVRLAPSAADHAVDPTVQDVEALLGNPGRT